MKVCCVVLGGGWCYFPKVVATFSHVYMCVCVCGGGGGGGPLIFKLRSHMRGAVAELRGRADFDILAPLPRVCSHICGADAERTRSGRICHFLRTMMVWSTRFRSGRGKLGAGPISCGADFAPAPPPLRDRACVNTCNDLCWSQFSARLRPLMCERTLSATTLDVWIISQLDSWSLSNAELSVHRSWSNFHQLF